MDKNKKLKNVFIGGVARSGKSTFSRKMCDVYDYNHFPLDYVVSSLKNNFPECNISSSVVIGDSSEKISLLMSTVIRIMDSKDEKFIIDTAHVMPKDIVPYLDREKWDIYFVGYPNVSKFTKFSTIRKYDNESDWTYRRTDEELLSIVEKLIEISKEISQQCEELGITFVDTSTDMMSVIDDFVSTDVI